MYENESESDMDHQAAPSWRSFREIVNGMGQVERLLLLTVIMLTLLRVGSEIKY